MSIHEREYMTSQNQKQAKLDPLEVKHRAERLSRDYDLNLNAEYFSKLHKRSLARIYEAYKGNAPTLLRKIDKHLNLIEQRKKLESQQA
jgi:CRISPR/Cas system endoribonuclease Cas6 (RAMP superfamily)